MTNREREMADAIARAEAVDDAEEDDAEYVRVPASVDPSQVYSVRIPVRRVEQLRHLAAARGMKPSALLRQWVIERLDRETAGVPVETVHVVVYTPEPQSEGRASRLILAELDERIENALATNRLGSGT